MKSSWESWPLVVRVCALGIWPLLATALEARTQAAQRVIISPIKGFLCACLCGLLGQADIATGQETTVNRFTLSCRGEFKSAILGRSSREFWVTFELQGKKGRYFKEGSTKWESLQEVTATELVFKREEDNESVLVESINRIDGRWEDYYVVFTRPEPIWEAAGTCTKVAYRKPELPTAKF